jgi:DNA-3-methyladenine glycosylase
MTDEFKLLSAGFYRRDPRRVARGLLGRYLVRRYQGRALVLRIVETEAYLGEGDRASHAWTGVPTQRTATLFRVGGCAYVYFVYGMHNMFNAVAGCEGEGGAVLVRAGEPVSGVGTMRGLRALGAGRGDAEIASGPGKLCRALAIDRAFDGASLDSEELRICHGRAVGRRHVVVGPRVGVAYAGEAAAWPLRFAVAGNLHVSRPWVFSAVKD